METKTKDNQQGTSSTILPSRHSTHYKEKNVISESLKFSSRMAKPLPVYTVGWKSRTNPFFMPVTGLDYLIGVQEVLLLQTVVDLSSTKSTFLIKIPNGETLYMGLENSSSIQRALFCSQRSFNMTLLDPGKEEAANLVRKGAFTNAATFFRQELQLFVPGKTFPIGRVVQDRNFSTVSFSVLDEEGENLLKIIASEKSCFCSLNPDISFYVVNKNNETDGSIVHKWDNKYSDFIYHITFPLIDTCLNKKMLIIGAALLVEFTYFNKTGCLGCLT